MLAARFLLRIHFVLDVCKFWGALTSITTTATSKYTLFALMSVNGTVPLTLELWTNFNEERVLVFAETLSSYAC